MVRALHMTPEQLNAILSNGTIPQRNLPMEYEQEEQQYEE